MRSVEHIRLPVFLLSCLLAFLAGHIINYSIIFMALERFDSHALAGIGYGLCFGPPLFLGWLAGVYCDRYSPRHVILITQNSYFISLLLLYFSFQINPELQRTLLLTAAFFSGIGWSFVAPARFATLPFYVAPQKLTGASIALNLMVMSGFGLAPMLLKQVKVVWGWDGVLLSSALLLVVSTALLLPLRFHFTSKATDKAFSEIKSSLSYVRQSIMIRQLLMLAAIAYLLMGPMQVLLPSVAEHTLHLNEVAQGNYLSLVAFSLIIGGLLAMSMKNSGKLGLQILFAILFAATGLATLGIAANLTVSIIILVLSGICGGVAISYLVAGLQHYSPDEHRGRIMSFYTIVGQVVPAASGVGAGLLAQAYNSQIALQISSAFIVICILLCFILLTPVRRLESYRYV
jgi:MFS family permease